MEFYAVDFFTKVLRRKSANYFSFLKNQTLTKFQDGIFVALERNMAQLEAYKHLQTEEQQKLKE
ncbi:MAG: hypothetical protein ABSF65_08970, partial [Candidatus Bathyarchaeia archaeon]